ncbi:flagellar motor switch phosphatase FliY [Eubacterium xylanophilum]|uniref:flagellar motor switch phosphatase FliY n=1 Tax=Eubacterium xylanophilum TaxID=39497 RepID=UPI0004786B2D|nr:flagellar motor switch phosphatase FliY [Eubacterium xylanophilum]
MDGMLSQEEINALLGSMEADEPVEPVAAEGDSAPAEGAGEEVRLSSDESDALGEIANISMGTAATTLSVLVNNRVEITTPSLSYIKLEDLKGLSEAPCVFIYISYKSGLQGRNVLIIKERDVKVITDLMMGGDGTNTEAELTELHLSAICEAMNQMMGSAATSMSSMLDEVVDISPPTSVKVDFDQDQIEIEGLEDMKDKTFVQVSFRMTIGDLVDSEIVQLYPIDFVRMIYDRFTSNMAGGEAEEPAPVPEPAPAPMPDPVSAQPQATPPQGMPANQGMMQQPYVAAPQQELNVQPAQFQSFVPIQNMGGIAPENIDLIMDVPLEVTVELGRTSKSIKEILDFSPGTIIELDKLAGAPIDVLVNGKFIALGEVVVIEESFGVRVTEIIKE